MSRPESVRRIKSYSAASGYVYQYSFSEVNRLNVNGEEIGEFLYAVSADRKTSFPVRILVEQQALNNWARVNGRALTSSEEYAIAKMRFFQALDEEEEPLNEETAAQRPFVVTDANLEGLLKQLHI